MTPEEITNVELDVSDELGIPPIHVCVVGSQRICGHGKDIDVLCLVSEAVDLEGAGYLPDLESAYADSQLYSWRKGSVNIVVVTTIEHFIAEMTIAHAARVCFCGSVNVEDRDGRVAFHGAIRRMLTNRIGLMIAERLPIDT
jgi:hypothetical protein